MSVSHCVKREASRSMLHQGGLAMREGGRERNALDFKDSLNVEIPAGALDSGAKFEAGRSGGFVGCEIELARAAKEDRKSTDREP